MLVSLYFDFICPWSYIGKKIFDHSLGYFPTPPSLESRWIAYPLIHQNSYMNSQAELKYHDDVIIQSRKMGKTLGLDFNYSRISQISNSLNALILITALQRDFKIDFISLSALIDRIFEAYFHDGHNIEDFDLLMHIGKFSKSEAKELAAVIDAKQYTNTIQTEQLGAKKSGILTTPTFLFDGQYQISSVMEEGCFEAVADIMRQARSGLATKS